MIDSEMPVILYDLGLIYKVDLDGKTIKKLK